MFALIKLRTDDYPEQMVAEVKTAATKQELIDYFEREHARDYDDGDGAAALIQQLTFDDHVEAGEDRVFVIREVTP